MGVRSLAIYTDAYYKLAALSLNPRETPFLTFNLANMDYSAISHDPENPAGASPWGSPRADRTTFPTSGNGDIPSSPIPGQDRSAGGFEGSNAAEAQSPDLSAQLQSARIGDPDYAGEQPPSATRQSPNADQQRAQHPAQHQTGVRQNSRPPAPVYKIQGKITGLERTGKKDPILRFDVHVSRLYDMLRSADD